jgi:hypothetical protein
VAVDLLDGVGSEVREAAVLEVAPEQLDGIEFWRVGREADDVKAPMGGQPRPHEVVLVGAAAVPEQNDGPAHVPGKVAKKPEHLRPADVDPWEQCQGEGELAAAGRHDQGADAGHLFMGARAHGQRRRDAARRPRAPEDRHHQEAGFIERDQVGAESAEFFLPAPTPADATRESDGRCVLWRAVGDAEG